MTFVFVIVYAHSAMTTNSAPFVDEAGTPKEVALHAKHIETPEIFGRVLSALVHVVRKDVKLHINTLSCVWIKHQHQKSD